MRDGLGCAVRNPALLIYIQYHTARRFAEKVLGVDLETWWARHPDVPWLIETSEQWLEMEAELELAEEYVNQEWPATSETKTLEERVAAELEDLAAAWDGIVPTA